MPSELWQASLHVAGLEHHLVLLRAEGAEALWFPAARIEEATDPEPLRLEAARVRAGAYDWLVFTSANAVSSFWHALGQGGPRAPAGAPVLH